MRLRLVTCLLACFIVAGTAAAALRGRIVPNAAADGGPRNCQSRDNDTIAKLEECIRQAGLWNHLAPFQRIADEHPGPGGHPNRNIGTPGYWGSVQYVSRLMREAGYNVTIQPYPYKKNDVVGIPRFGTADHVYAPERDFFVARLSVGGTLTAPVELTRGKGDGCSAGDFASLRPGRVALLERGACTFDTQVENAESAGASAVVIYNTPDGGDPYEARLVDEPNVPVIGLASYAVGQELVRGCRSRGCASVHIEVNTERKTGIDHNVIADSPYGDPNRVVVIDAHLDSIYGAGMLDNASGSATILDVALNLAKTPTRNRLRYIWFGGEEVGLLGSKYYTRTLSRAELRRIAFDVDVDVTATPNFDILVAAPGRAADADRFPPNVVPQSKIGNDLFADFFQAGGVVSREARFGNAGTDSKSFSYVGVPNSGVLTQQDCCKHRWETRLWGGFLGNYEGKIPSFNGGCVDYPHRWCDNLPNNDPFVLELVGKSVAYVTFKLANAALPH